ncbi:MAG TPA: glycosyltransferase [Anaerolineae bacterium]
MTYARPTLLEEAIYSFLQQDYNGPKELLVLNDYEQQILAVDHPQVRVINVPVRFRTIGEKTNVAVALASHKLLFVWDDDDIYLSHRLTFSVEKLETGKGFFKPNKAWLWNNNLLCGPEKNLFHAGSWWSRDLFDAVRGYVADGPGQDAVFEACLEQKFPGSTKPYDIKPEEIYYIYRWGGTGSYHLSGFGDYQPGKNVGHDEVAAFVQQQVDRGEIPQGSITLQPHWKFDYQQLVSDYLQSI